MTSKVRCCVLEAKDEEERDYCSLGIVISFSLNFTGLHVSAEREMKAHTVVCFPSYHLCNLRSPGSAQANIHHCDAQEFPLL